MVNYDLAIWDYDGTLVDSQHDVHYPIYLELMDSMRKNYSIVEEMVLSPEGFIHTNHTGGIKRHYVEDHGFSEEQWEFAFNYWKERIMSDEFKPHFFEGIPALFERVRNAGIIPTIVSHSTEDSIRQNFSHHGVEAPEFIIGTTDDRSKNKPSAYPAVTIMQHYGVTPHAVVVIGDGADEMEMARNAGIENTIGVGFDAPSPASFIKRCSQHVTTPEDLETLLLQHN
jgi:phosphoglycolate phosphatase-like HAD superfamily hydrolase